MIRCARCQFDNAEGSHFCMRCGSPLTIAQPRRTKAAMSQATLARSPKNIKLKWVGVGVVGLVVLIGIGAAFSQGPTQNTPTGGGGGGGPPGGGGGSGGGSGGGGGGGGGSSATTTTLAAIVAGDFPSAVDKQGDGGTYVEVRDVVVIKIRAEETDGDWHIYIKDPTYPQFIGEIIPRDQGTEGRPPVGVSLLVRGITYCDHQHEDAIWHGSTCWEIHPLTAWERT